MNWFFLALEGGLIVYYVFVLQSSSAWYKFVFKGIGGDSPQLVTEMRSIIILAILVCLLIRNELDRGWHK